METNAYEIVSPRTSALP